MLHKARCKFYVSAQNISSTQPFDNQSTYFSATIKLNAAYSPDSTTENYSFWKATPCGNATIHITGEEQIEKFKAGSFWYIDIWEDADGDWKLQKYESNEYNLNVELVNKTSGFAEMYGGNIISLSITNEKAWTVFEEGKKYQAEFIPAIKS